MEALISPQPCAVGEASNLDAENRSKSSYASRVSGKQTIDSQLDLCPISLDQDLPTVEFTVDEINAFTKEEGLHQAVIIKFSYGKPDLQELRQILPKQLDVKGSCNIGQLEFRHILIRFDLIEDFSQVISRSNGYIRSKGSDFFFRTFPWTMDFNPRKETPKAVIWISFPDLPANLFAKKSLLSMAASVGKPIAIDKATKDRTRPSTARVKVLVNLLDEFPSKVKIKIVDPKSGKTVNIDQKIVIDNAPAFCTLCNHQGHTVNSCRRSSSKEVLASANVSIVSNNMQKLKGDARDYLNAKQARRRNGVQVEQQQVSNSAAQTAQIVSKHGNNQEQHSSTASVLNKEKANIIEDPSNRGITIVNGNMDPSSREEVTILSDTSNITFDMSKSVDNVVITDVKGVNCQNIGHLDNSVDQMANDSQYGNKGVNRSEAHKINAVWKQKIRPEPSLIAEADNSITKAIIMKSPCLTGPSDSIVNEEEILNQQVNQSDVMEVIPNVDDAGTQELSKQIDHVNLCRNVPLQMSKSVVQRVQEHHNAQNDNNVQSVLEVTKQVDKANTCSIVPLQSSGSVGQIDQECPHPKGQEMLGNERKKSESMLKETDQNKREYAAVIKKEKQPKISTVSLKYINMADFKSSLLHSTHEQGSISGVNYDLVQQNSIRMGKFDEARMHHSEQQHSFFPVEQLSADAYPYQTMAVQPTDNSGSQLVNADSSSIMDSINFQEKTTTSADQFCSTLSKNAETFLNQNRQIAEENSNLSLSSKSPIVFTGGNIQSVKSYPIIPYTFIEQKDHEVFSIFNGQNKPSVLPNRKELVIKSKLWDQRQCEYEEGWEEGSTDTSSSEEDDDNSLANLFSQEKNAAVIELVKNTMGKIHNDKAEMHSFEEGEEEEMLMQCRKDAARKGDLSPIHSKRKKKGRQRDKSWDGRVTEERNIRRPPMRIAKLKQMNQRV